MKPTHPLDEQPPPVTANTRAFRVLVRNALFRRVELAAAGDWATLVELDPDVDWAAALTPYFTEHREILTGANARGPHLLMIDEQPSRWFVRQIWTIRPATTTGVSRPRSTWRAATPKGRRSWS